MVLDWKPAEKEFVVVAEDGDGVWIGVCHCSRKTVELPDVWTLQGLLVLWPCMWLNT